jgi:hypothetical protein
MFIISPPPSCYSYKTENVMVLDFSSRKVQQSSCEDKLSLCESKHHVVKTYWGSSGIDPSILNIGTRYNTEVPFRNVNSVTTVFEICHGFRSLWDCTFRTFRLKAMLKSMGHFSLVCHTSHWSS